MVKTRPVVAVDIDGVLFPFRELFIEHHNQAHSTELELAKWQAYDMAEFLALSPQATIERIEEFYQAQDSHVTDPVPGAKEAINKLARHYRLVVITARPAHIAELTTKWLDDHFPKAFADVFFAAAEYHTGYVSKLDLCVMSQAGTLIDDSIEFITEVASKGIAGVLFGDDIWNQGKLPPNAKRAQDWPAVEGILLGS